MKRFWVGSAACAILLAAAGPAAAQPPIPGGAQTRPPVFSPYLNLTRPGGSVTLNYFGLVRPEVEARRAIGNLNTNVLANRAAIGNLQESANTLEDELSGPRVVPAFLNRGSYFQSTGGYFAAGPGTGAMATGATVPGGPLRPVNTLSANPAVAPAGMGGPVYRPVNTLGRRAPAAKP